MKLGDYWGVLRSSWASIAACSLIGIAVAAIVSLVTPVGPTAAVITALVIGLVIGALVGVGRAVVRGARRGPSIARKAATSRPASVSGRPGSDGPAPASRVEDAVTDAPDTQGTEPEPANPEPAPRERVSWLDDLDLGAASSDAEELTVASTSPASDATTPDTPASGVVEHHLDEQATSDDLMVGPSVAADDDHGIFSILTVCTGNICRSPAAERLLAVAFGPDVRLESAGTAAVVAHPIEEHMVQVLESDGVDVSGFAAQQVTDTLLKDADLILTMTQEHRSSVLRLAPSALRRTYTLHEFAWILGSTGTDPRLAPDASDAARLRAALKRVVAARGMAGPPPQGLDIADPYGGTAEDYRQAYDLIRDDIAKIAVGVGSGN